MSIRFRGCALFNLSAFIAFLFFPGETRAQAPASPSNLKVTTLSDSALLSWQDNSNNEAGFAIERKKSGETYANFANPPANFSGWTDSGLTLGTTYCWRVFSWNSSGASASYSNEVCAPALSTPTLTAPSNGAVNPTELRWNAVTGATSYRGNIHTSCQSIQLDNSDPNVWTDSSRVHTVPSLPPGTYYWRVLAFKEAVSGGGGISGESGCRHFVVEQALTGACCISGTCSTGTTQSACTNQGGVWQGANTTSCSNCNATGACCISGSCSTGYTQTNCQNQGGAWQGVNTTTCSNCNPPPATGACCISGSCSTGYTQTNCQNQGGAWQGVNTTTCSNCNPPPATGACCISDDCSTGYTQTNCQNQGGAWQGVNSTTCQNCTASQTPTECCTSIKGSVDNYVTLRLPFTTNTTQCVTQGYKCGGSSHSGFEVDFDLPEGTAVIAVAGGKVVKVGDYASNSQDGKDENGVELSADDKLGISIKIQHTGKENTIWYSHYAHLREKPLFKMNEVVLPGSVIGYSGNTGYAVGQNGGYHLHLQMKKGNTGVRPVPMVGQKVGSSSQLITDFCPGSCYVAIDPVYGGGDDGTGPPEECTTDSDCEDDDACTLDYCDDAECHHLDNGDCECTDDDDCDDPLFCNGREQCNDRQCEPGEPPCDDDEECDESANECLDAALVPPSGVIASVDSIVNAVHISWGPVSGATVYDVFRCDPDFCGILIFGTEGTAFEDNTAIPGVDYYYSVAARNDFGHSDPSALVFGRAGAPPEPPPGSPSGGSPCGATGMLGLILVIGSIVPLKLFRSRWRAPKVIS
jgi:hypothetical protein